MTFKFLKRKNK